MTDPHDQIVLFATRWGRFMTTRAERYRLALSHGVHEPGARRLAYGRDNAKPPPPDHPEPTHVFTAAQLAAAFDADGQALPGQGGLRGLPRGPATFIGPARWAAHQPGTEKEMPR